TLEAFRTFMMVRLSGGRPMAGILAMGVDRTDLPDFEELFRFEYPRLAMALFLLTGSGADAEDLAQEALARAYERWDKVRRMKSPVGYVYRTALNLNRDRLRRLRVRAAFRLGPGPSEMDPMAAVDTRNEVLSILASLPRAQREALVLVEWLGFETEQAGELLGIDAASVRGRLHRARAVVRERYGG